jgi:hypothetical protein
MQFMLAIYEDDSIYTGPRGEKAWAEILAAHTAFAGALVEAGLMRGGEGLERAHTATTIRNAGGKVTIHDGPFAETREQLGGFYVIEAASLDEALAWARRIPLAAGGAVEVRPCLPPPE